MPTASNGQAVLDLSDPALRPAVPDIWTESTTWFDITQKSLPPWLRSEDDGVGSGIVPPVVSFVNKYWATPQDERRDFLSGKGTNGDNDQLGRKVYDRWLQKAWETWEIKKILREALEADGSDPWSIIEETGDPQYPTMSEAQVDESYVQIAEDLFGETAFKSGKGRKILPAVKKFVSTIMANTWNSWRVQIGRHRKYIVDLQLDIDSTWAEFTANKDKVTKPALRQWLTKLQSLLEYMKPLKDTETIAALEARLETLHGMMEAMGLDSTGKVNKELPPTILKALQEMADEKDIRSIRTLVYESIMIVEDETPFELPTGESVDLEWSEGTDKYQNYTMEDAKRALGIDTMPYFNEWLDPKGEKTYASHPKWFADEANVKLPCVPRWHQLIGILTLLEAAFENRHMLLMDDMGLGKTMQIAGLIAIITYFREYYDKNQCFPGAFSKYLVDRDNYSQPDEHSAENKKFQGREGNIPDLSSIIAVPKSIHAQFSRELRRYLIPAAFDVIPYIGKHEKRLNYWTHVWTRSKQTPGHKILLATVSALEDDAARATSFSKRDPFHSLEVRRQHAKSSTVFAQDWTLFAVDEAHKCRTLNMTYRATAGLRRSSHFVVAVTATPITTSPKDIWNIGRCLGIESLDCVDGDDDYRDIKTKLGAAARKDRQARAKREASQGNNPLSMGNFKSEHTDALVAEIVSDLREQFTGHVIRRTGLSKDCNGQPLSGIAVAREHSLHITLHTHEMQFIQALTKEYMDPKGKKVPMTGKDFYIGTRRALSHIACLSNSGVVWVTPTTIAEWLQFPSSKLQVLAGLVVHHLSHDNAQPMRIVGERDLEVNPDAEVKERQPDLPPDRIVVYSAFPSSSHIILDVLNLYDIKVVEFNGSMSEKARVAALKEFKDEDPETARVMLMSNVGQTGLNLDFANVLIIIDALWSIMDDLQLQGRLKRFPQNKQVEVYRMIGLGTADELINALSTGKGTIHEVFTKTPLAYQKVLRSGMQLMDDNLSEDDIQVDEESGSDVEPPKKKAPARRAAPTKAASKKAPRKEAAPKQPAPKRPRPRKTQPKKSAPVIPSSSPSPPPPPPPVASTSRLSPAASSSTSFPPPPPPIDEPDSDESRASDGERAPDDEVATSDKGKGKGKERMSESTTQPDVDAPMQPDVDAPMQPDVDAPTQPITSAHELWDFVTMLPAGPLSVDVLTYQQTEHWKAMDDQTRLYYTRRLVDYHRWLAGKAAAAARDAKARDSAAPLQDSQDPPSPPFSSFGPPSSAPTEHPSPPFSTLGFPPSQPDEIIAALADFANSTLCKDIATYKSSPEYKILPPLKKGLYTKAIKAYVGKQGRDAKRAASQRSSQAGDTEMSQSEVDPDSEMGAGESQSGADDTSGAAKSLLSALGDLGFGGPSSATAEGAPTDSQRTASEREPTADPKPEERRQDQEDTAPGADQEPTRPTSRGPKSPTPGAPPKKRPRHNMENPPLRPGSADVRSTKGLPAAPAPRSRSTSKGV
ncbi:hypothetical protein HWV62_2906 [Athelia sp. TMB]|nr:hypothetical protein HWV62_2906 [Athelia sp. TMB]